MPTTPQTNAWNTRYGYADTGGYEEPIPSTKKHRLTETWTAAPAVPMYAIRDTVAEDLEEGYGALASTVYRGGMALLDRAINTYFGKGVYSAALTTFLNTTGNAGEQFVRERENGASEKTAMNRACTSFAVDLAMDTPIMKRIFGEWTGQGIKGIAKAAVAEGAQDAAVTALTTFADVCLNGKESELIQSYDLYMEAGMTKAEAQKR